MSNAKSFLAGAAFGAFLVVLGLVVLLAATHVKPHTSDVNLTQLIFIMAAAALIFVGAVVALLGCLAAVFSKARDEKKNPHEDQPGDRCGMRTGGSVR